jgi:hypothetical protein
VVCKLMALLASVQFFITEYAVTTVSADNLHVSENEIISLTVKYG